MWFIGGPPNLRPNPLPPGGGFDAYQPSMEHPAVAARADRPTVPRADGAGPSGAAAAAAPAAAAAGSSGAGASTSAAAAAAADATVSTSVASTDKPAALPQPSAGELVSRSITSLLAELKPVLQPLWDALSRCIGTIEASMGDKSGAGEGGAAPRGAGGAAKVLPTGSVQVLPLVEAFFVVCSLNDTLPPAPAAPGSTSIVPGATLLRPASFTGGALAAAPSATVPATPSAAVRPPGGLTPMQSQDLARLAEIVAAAPGATPASASVADATSMPPPRTPAPALGARGSEHGGGAEPDAKYAPFVSFVEQHTRLLNAYVRRNHSLLEGSLAPMMHLHKLIDFDNKRTWFRAKVGCTLAFWGPAYAIALGAV